MSGMNWELARRRDITAARPVPAGEGKKGFVRTVPKPKSITAKQSRFYRSLCEQIGRPYDGATMTAREAREAIDATLLSLRTKGGEPT